MIQIDMPMPEACDVCPFNYDFCWCKAFGDHDNWEKYSDDWNNNVCERTTRPEYCPLKEQEAKWIHREDMDFIDKYDCNHFHGMCTNCGLVHDFIDGHTGQYLYCPQCGKAVKWE